MIIILNLEYYKPKSEKELHSLIEKRLDKIGNGLTLLRHEFEYEGQIPDFLCVDQEGSLVSIEVKLGKDEKVIFQAIRYYEMLIRNIYFIAKSISIVKINPEKDIKNIIIAEDFTEETKKLMQYLENLDIELYMYRVYTDKDKEGEKDIIFELVDTPITTTQKPIEEYTIEQHRNYCSTEELRKVFDKIIQDIKLINNDLIDYSVRKYVGIKYKGKTVTKIVSRKTYFWLITFKYNEEGSYERKISSKVETGKENDIQEVFQGIKDEIKRLDERQ